MTASAALLAVGGCGGATPSAAHRTAPAVLAPATAPPTTRPPAPVARYPLTGLAVTDPAAAARPALSVKIDNVAGSFPQAGLDRADIVTVALVEGGLTRLFATFQSQGAPLVGPIRSARPVDADLLRELGGGVFAYSGAAAGEIAPVKAYSTATRVAFDDDPAPFHRRPGYRPPHDVFSDTAVLWRVGRAAGARWAPPPALFAYAAAAPRGTPTHAVAMAYSSFSSDGWTWDGHRWLRTQNGSADAVTGGQRVSADNVVIMSVGTKGTGITDAAGNEDPWPVVIGSGDAWVLRDGVLVKGMWHRASVTSRTILTGPDGRIALTPGRTWVELLPQPHRPDFS